jgi:hypothetical protein
MRGRRLGEDSGSDRWNAWDGYFACEGGVA